MYSGQLLEVIYCATRVVSIPKLPYWPSPQNWALSMSLSLHGAEPLETWAETFDLLECYKAVVTSMNEKLQLSEFIPHAWWVRGSKNYTPIQLPILVNCELSSWFSMANRDENVVPYTGPSLQACRKFTLQAPLHQRSICFTTGTTRQLSYLEWPSVSYFYNCTIFARKQRYKHNCSLYASSQPSSMKARNCCRYVTFPTHRL